MSQTSRNDLLEACSGAGESARAVILTLFWTVMVPLFAYTARQVNKSGDFRNFFENSWEPQRHLLVCTSSLQSGGFRTCPLGGGRGCAVAREPRDSGEPFFRSLRQMTGEPGASGRTP